MPLRLVSPFGRRIWSGSGKDGIDERLRLVEVHRVARTVDLD